MTVKPQNNMTREQATRTDFSKPVPAARHELLKPGARACIFFHIPKTAGTTLENILLRQYRYGEAYPYVEVKDYWTLRALPPAAKAQYKLFWGHMPFGLHETLSQPSTYFTMLREPIDLALSSYFYFEMDYRTSILKQDVAPHMPSIDDLRNGTMRDMFDNMQTRFLSGDLFAKFGGVTREMLERAQEHLARYFIVGLVERFDESLVMLTKAFGWRAPYYVKSNITRTRPRGERVPAEVMAWLREQNQLDAELYAFAQKLFAEQIQLQGPDFAPQVAAYRQRNQLYGPWFDRISRAKRRVKDVPFIGEFV